MRHGVRITPSSQARAGAARTLPGIRNELQEIFHRLLQFYGPQRWWPARTRTEMVVGAILTQNTAWTNVERAIGQLRRSRCLTWTALRDIAESDLAERIRPSGTYRVKARRLKAFVSVLWTNHAGRLDDMLSGDLDAARRRLLRIPGIGPETADAILLYAGNRPTFVVDAYTRRVLRRHRLIAADADYGAIQRLFHTSLPAHPLLFNEYHALLVAVGKRHCRTSAQCAGCPLESLPHTLNAP